MRFPHTRAQRNKKLTKMKNWLKFLFTARKKNHHTHKCRKYKKKQEISKKKKKRGLFPQTSTLDTLYDGKKVRIFETNVLILQWIPRNWTENLFSQFVNEIAEQRAS